MMCQLRWLTTGLTPEIIQASRQGDTAFIVRWVACGGDVNATTRDLVSPLIYASSRGQVDAMKVYLANGADVNNNRCSGANDFGSRPHPLHAAIRFGSHAAVRLLIEHGARVDTQDGYGHTPLIVAAERGRFDITCLLLANGASLEPRTTFGRNAVQTSRYFATSSKTTSLLVQVTHAGGWATYARGNLVVLRVLCARERASPPPELEHLIGASSALPDPVFFLVLEYWA